MTKASCASFVITTLMYQLVVLPLFIDHLYQGGIKTDIVLEVCTHRSSVKNYIRKL